MPRASSAETASPDVRIHAPSALLPPSTARFTPSFPTPRSSKSSRPLPPHTAGSHPDPSAYPPSPKATGSPPGPPSSHHPAQNESADRSPRNTHCTTSHFLNLRQCAARLRRQQRGSPSAPTTLIRAPIPVLLLFVPTTRILIQLRFSCRIAPQQLRHRIHAIHHHIQIAIVVVVAHRKPARLRLRRNPAARPAILTSSNCPLRKLRYRYFRSA